MVSRSQLEKNHLCVQAKCNHLSFCSPWKFMSWREQLHKGSTVQKQIKNGEGTRSLGTEETGTQLTDLTQLFT